MQSSINIMIDTNRQASADAYLRAETNGGGLSLPTQDVSGVPGSVRNEAMTIWAHGERGITKCPMPGMLMTVALDRFAATEAVKSSDATASKLPEMSSVGMLLTRGRRTFAGAVGTFQTLVQSSLAYAQVLTA
jgi:hypothetical protein